ncbi:hypothetical protein SVAN01_03679 [Stagonosporopsis vannaccii]|nr:hypothetical protein SVAN01_03679 [Stagonosporopsis vannaccii]
MYSLLSLPREIRDQIIEHVLLSHEKPPLDPANEVDSRQNTTRQGSLRPPNMRLYSASGLLGVNSQLRYETQTRLSQLNVPYSLDVMVVDNELWPTWTCCPMRAPDRIDRIDVSLRFFGKPNDPFMVHVARTFWAILQGRTWKNTSLHPLAELFLYIRAVCFQSDLKKANVIGTLCFDASTKDRLNQVASMAPSEPLSSIGLKSMFGKHRSLWNSFRSIHQYPFANNGEIRRLETVASLKIMVVLFLQESWEDECAIYSSYVGPMGAAFRAVQTIEFRVDGQDLGLLTSHTLSA